MWPEMATKRIQSMLSPAAEVSHEEAMPASSSIHCGFFYIYIRHKRQTKKSSREENINIYRSVGKKTTRGNRDSREALQHGQCPGRSRDKSSGMWEQAISAASTCSMPRYMEKEHLLPKNRKEISVQLSMQILLLTKEVIGFFSSFFFVVRDSVPLFRGMK